MRGNSSLLLGKDLFHQLNNPLNNLKSVNYVHRLMHCHLFVQSVFIGVLSPSHRVHPKLDHPMHLHKIYLFHNSIHLLPNSIIHLFCPIPNCCHHLN
jgi:hypothetical protein